MDQEGLCKESVDLYEHQIKTFASECLKRLNLITPPISKVAPDKTINTNKEFWNSVTGYSVDVFKAINLKGFQVVDWFPHSPGLYYTDHAEQCQTS